MHHIFLRVIVNTLFISNYLASCVCVCLFSKASKILLSDIFTWRNLFQKTSLLPVMLPVVLLSLQVSYSATGSPLSSDSLSKVSNTVDADTTAVNSLADLAFEVGGTDNKEGLRKAYDAVKLAEKINYQRGIIKARGVLGRLLYEKGDLDSAMIYYSEILPAVEKHGTLAERIALYRNIAMVHQERQDYQNASRYYEKELAIAKKLRDAKRLGNAYNDMGSFFLNQSFTASDSLSRITFLKKSKPYFITAISWFRQDDYERGIALCNGNLAHVSDGLGSLSEALGYSYETLNYFLKNNLTTYISISYDQLTKIFVKMNQLDSALKYAGKCLEIGQQMDNNFDIRNAYGEFTNIYERKGDYKQAFAYQKLFDEYSGKILDQESDAKIAELEQKYQSENKEREINALNAEKKLQEAEIRRQDMLLIFSVLIICLILVLAFILYFTSRKENKINQLLKKQKDEIENKNSLLQEKNAMIESQNEQITAKNERLEHLYDEHRSLMLMVVHDLQSPFNKIKGLTSILGLSGSINAEQEDIIQKIHQVSEGGRQLIADLTNVSYFEDENLVAKPKEFRLNYLLKKIQQEHETYANRKHINLILKPVKDEVVVSTDRDFFTRIMDNLLSNAIKYSPQNKNVYINPAVQNGSYSIEVRDEGPGISREDQKKLFRKFQKLSARPTAGENSTGLGLNIVKTLVEKMNGEISVSSKIGEGSSFVVRFPARV